MEERLTSGWFSRGGNDELIGKLFWVEVLKDVYPMVFSLDVVKKSMSAHFDAVMPRSDDTVPSVIVLVAMLILCIRCVQRS